MLSHPAHVLALGLGSGLSPWAPGTAGTLWAWASFALLSRWWPSATPGTWGLVLGVGTLVGWWACTLTARHLRQADPGAIVWDEIIAFWLVLWLVTPAGWMAQAAAFGLFRFFDAVKPGPVGWADRCFKLSPRQALPGAAQGFGILWDDFVAAGCTLLVIALWRAWMG